MRQVACIRAPPSGVMENYVSGDKTLPHDDDDDGEKQHIPHYLSESLMSNKHLFWIFFLIFAVTSLPCICGDKCEADISCLIKYAMKFPH